MRSATAGLALLAALLPAAARAAGGEAAPYLVEIEVTRDGRTASASVEVPPGGSGSAETERRIPYAANLASADPDDAPGMASVVVGNSFRVSPVERDGGMSVSADIRLQKLAGSHRVEAIGRSMDLPDIDTVELAVRDGEMRREGDAWVMEREDEPSRARIRIVARR